MSHVETIKCALTLLLHGLLSMHILTHYVTCRMFGLMVVCWTYAHDVSGYIDTPIDPFFNFI